MFIHGVRSLLQPVALCCVFLGFPSISLCQSPPCSDLADRATVQSLLSEVRQLRLAIETAAPLMTRMQLVMTRFHRQEDKVNRLSRELREFRAQMSVNS